MRNSWNKSPKKKAKYQSRIKFSTTTGNRSNRTKIFRLQTKALSMSSIQEISENLKWNFSSKGYRKTPLHKTSKWIPTRQSMTLSKNSFHRFMKNQLKNYSLFIQVDNWEEKNLFLKNMSNQRLKSSAYIPNEIVKTRNLKLNTDNQ